MAEQTEAGNTFSESRRAELIAGIKELNEANGSHLANAFPMASGAEVLIFKWSTPLSTDQVPKIELLGVHPDLGPTEPSEPELHGQT